MFVQCTPSEPIVCRSAAPMETSRRTAFGKRASSASSKRRSGSHDSSKAWERLMERGVWHQFGDRSQLLVKEQLENGAGVGVILSVRDLSRNRLVSYSARYRQLGARVLIDQQFYNPAFSNQKLATYPISQFRASISTLNQISDQDLAQLAALLEEDNTSANADGLIAPAVTYEVGRQDIVDLNRRLFEMAKAVGDSMGIPTYATLMFGRSATASDHTLNAILSQATSLASDGWYFGFEFNDPRLPASKDDVIRCCSAGLTLACTGKPVLHAYAGPLALLSFGFGATGAGIGHAQNTWQFIRGRWDASTKTGGGPAAPRFFSRALWGTIIYPDETSQLPVAVRNQVLTQSSFSSPTASGLGWTRWDANKHLVNIICSTVSDVAATHNPRNNALTAKQLLDNAVQLHQHIASLGINLRDDTNVYQKSWSDAIDSLVSDRQDDYDYLDLL